MPGGGQPGSVPGRNGISRGPGPAQLNYTNDTELLTPPKATRLPRGRAISREWQVTGVNRVAPQTDPERAAGAGSAAPAGGGGEASWRRRVAPHHRAVVRRFFTGESKGN